MAGLKLSDIDILRELINSKTIQEVSRKMSLERTLIYRVLRQAEAYIGLEKGQWNWRLQGVPPELYRIVQSVNKNVNTEKQFPKISIGNTLSLFLMLFSHKNQLMLPQLEHFRTVDIVEALNSYKIDIAYGHHLAGESTNKESRLESVDLVHWNAVVVSSPTTNNAGKKSQDIDQLPSISWSIDSFADKLTKASETGNYVPLKINVTTEPIRYSESLELIRRGYRAKVVIPDIFLSQHDHKLLNISDPPKKISGFLSALFRTNDAVRIKPWIDSGRWNEVFYSTGGNSPENL